MWNCRSAGLQLSSGLLSACGLKSASHWSCRDSHVLPCHLYKHFLLLSSAFSGSQAVHVMSVPNSFDLRQFAVFNSAFLALMHVCSASIRKFHARLSFDVRSHRRQFNLFSCVKEALVTTQILLQIVDPSAGDNRQRLQKKCRCRGRGWQCSPCSVLFAWAVRQASGSRRKGETLLEPSGPCCRFTLRV